MTQYKLLLIIKEGAFLVGAAVQIEVSIGNGPLVEIVASIFGVQVRELGWEFLTVVAIILVGS